MEYFVNNWYIFVAIIAAIALIAVGIIKFLKMPSKQQIDNLKKWLRIAVTEAEIKLGSKTGALKLQMVYDMAISKFPWVAYLISFDTFKAFVDEALEWLEHQCETNAVIDTVVNINSIKLPEEHEDEEPTTTD